MLISTLRVATNFDNEDLRTFAIEKLEQKSLPPTDIIPIARELNIPRWETEALAKLASRTRPISLQEAQVLGMETFVELVHHREKQLARRPLSSMSVVIPSSGSSSSETVNGALQ